MSKEQQHPMDDWTAPIREALSLGDSDRALDLIEKAKPHAAGGDRRKDSIDRATRKNAFIAELYNQFLATNIESDKILAAKLLQKIDPAGLMPVFDETKSARRIQE